MVKHAAHAVYNSLYHFVWTPKYRKAVLRRSVKAYIEYLFRRIAREYGLEIVELAVAADHVHILVSAPPRYSPAQIVQWLKGISAREVFKRFPWLKNILWAGEFWSDGYYWGTVGDKTSTEVVLQYIRSQR